MVETARPSFLRAFISTSLIATFLLVLVPAPMAFGGGCPLNQGWIVDSITTDTQYGTRSAITLVVNPSTQCTSLRSVYIAKDDLNWVEVGWYEDGPDFPDDPCTDVSSPHILVYAWVDGFIKCKPNTAALTAGEEYSFRVDNPDHDFDYVYYWDDDTTPSISLGFFATDFRAGVPQMASERGATTDNLRAEFGGVNSLGGAGNWHSFTDPDVYSQGDVSPWISCTWSGTALIVKQSC